MSIIIRLKRKYSKYESNLLQRSYITTMWGNRIMPFVVNCEYSGEYERVWNSQLHIGILLCWLRTAI
jgi:hypothetical protein